MEAGDKNTLSVAKEASRSRDSEICMYTPPPSPKLLFPSLASEARHCQPLAIGEQCYGLRELCMITPTVASTIFFLIVLRS